MIQILGGWGEGESICEQGPLTPALSPKTPTFMRIGLDASLASMFRGRGGRKMRNFKTRERGIPSVFLAHASGYFCAAF